MQAMAELEGKLSRVLVAPSDQENRPEPRSAKSRIPLLRSRLPLSKLPQSKSHRAMNKDDEDKSAPKLSEDVPVVNTPCSRPTQDQTQKTKVKAIPNFKKLHLKWDKKLDKAKDSRKKARILHPAVSPLAPIMNNGSTRRLHASTVLKRQDAVKALADSLFRKIAQTTGDTIRVMSRIGNDDIETAMNLEKQFSEVADNANRQSDLPELSKISCRHGNSHNVISSTVEPCVYDESLPRYYTPASFYEIDNELCTILDTQQSPCSQSYSGRENPHAWIIDHYYFLPVKS